MLESYLAAYNLEIQSSEKLEGYGSLNYHLKSTAGPSYLLKVYKEAKDYPLVLEETRIIQLLADKIPLEFSSPILNNEKQILTKLEDGSFCRLTHFIEGQLLKDEALTEEMLSTLGQTIAAFHNATEGITSSVIGSRKDSWDLKYAEIVTPLINHVVDPSDRKLALYFQDQFMNFVYPQQENFSIGIIHNDLNEQNLIYENGVLKGVIDFGDISYSPHIYDLSIMLAYLLMLTEDHKFVLKHCLEGYSKVRSIKKIEADALYHAIAARVVCSVSHSAQNRAHDTATEYILGNEKPGWQFLHRWISTNPLVVKSLAYDAFGLKEANSYTTKEVEKKRALLIPAALKLSYTDPIHFHSASFQYMYDQKGNCYLDAYNNIPIVGHNHPEISIAVCEQIRKLNTNTRYHYNLLGDYAEQLLEKVPAQLSKVVFLNSGSAATDLALRISRQYTQKDNIAVIEEGYHGNTALSINASLYKMEGKGGPGIPNNIVKLPLIPQGLDGKILPQKIQEALNILESSKESLSAILFEPISGCGGQVPLDPSFLLALEAFSKNNKIPFIADEVQTGFGRVGSHFWAHEIAGVKSDMMILGKSIGNGHPLAALVMTEEIADAFDNGMEFFSSFGGNPISCIVGKKVLDIIESESLQANALEVGNYFMSQLKDIQKQYTSIKEVRGSGLFIGIELHDEATGIAASTQAKSIKEYLKRNFILSSTDGKYDHVIKIKPPLCFTKENADRFCEVFKEAMS